MKGCEVDWEGEEGLASDSRDFVVWGLSAVIERQKKRRKSQRERKRQHGLEREEKEGKTDSSDPSFAHASVPPPYEQTG